MKRFSKIISVILVCAVLVSCAFVQAAAVSPEYNIWDGTTLGGEIKGGGTEQNPYLIENGAQLAWIITHGGTSRYYKLVNDIYLNDPDKVDWSTGEGKDGYSPKSWYTSDSAGKFNGTINGDGHVIYGLYYKDATEAGSRTTGYGLIPYGGNIVIKNLGVDKSYLEAYTNYSLGVFVGLGQGSLKGLITDCYSGAEVTVKGYDAGSIVGGGDIASVLTIENTYSLATVNGSHLGGMVGDIWTNEYHINNVYAVGTKVTGKGEPVTKNAYSTEPSNNCIHLSAENMKGRIFEGNAMALGDAFVAYTQYPVLAVFADNGSNPWNGLGEAFQIGSGTEEDPYIITTAGQLALAVYNGTGHYKLAKDIYLNDIQQINWSDGTVKNTDYIPNSWFTGNEKNSNKYTGKNGLQHFSGTLDGNGYAVYGLWYSPQNKQSTAGLVPAVYSGKVKNLTLSHSYVMGGRFTGAVSSYFAGELSGCLVDSTVTVHGVDGNNYESESIGGLVGWGNGITLTNCGFAGTLAKIGAGGHHIYGLVGTSWGTYIKAENCFSLAYQPFTTSIGTNTFNTEAEAKAYFNNLYSAKNVYTDRVSKENKVSYKLGSTTKSLTVFAFSELKSAQIKSEDALVNMQGFSADVWLPREAAEPTLKVYSVAHGDVNGDKVFADAEDNKALRKVLLDGAKAKNSDVTQNGKVNICDLVAINLYDDFVIPAVHNPTVANYSDLKVDGSYRLVYPKDDTNALLSAKQLKNYFAAKGYDLTIVDDSAAPTEKEILVGNTNRAESTHALAENQYESKVSGSKLVIAAGHNLALDEAVGAFIASPYRLGLVPTFCGFVNAQTSVTLSNGNTYTYVWGDEFGGNTLDRNKWVCSVNSSKMSGFADMPILDDARTVKVTDGKLRLSAIPYTKEGNDEIKYAVPASVHSQGKMEYRYGYAEIRARVPYEQGVWPSFWMQSTTVLGGRQCMAYFVEVDVFEIFGTPNTVVPNLHKWYKAEHDPSTHECSYTGTHTQSGTDKRYNFANAANLSNEYHTYGFEWTPTEMSMYVDGQCYKTYDITKSYDNCSDVSGFQDPMYFIFNNHLFSPASSYKPNSITGNEAVIPAHYEIDWFRLYQTDEIQNTDIWLGK